MHELKTTTVELGKESNSSVMQRNGSACGYLRIRRRSVMNAEQDREEEPRLKLLHLDAEYVNGLGKTAGQQRSSTAAATSRLLVNEIQTARSGAKLGQRWRRTRERGHGRWAAFIGARVWRARHNPRKIRAWLWTRNKSRSASAGCGRRRRRVGPPRHR